MSRNIEELSHEQALEMRAQLMDRGYEPTLKRIMAGVKSDGSDPVPFCALLNFKAPEGLVEDFREHGKLEEVNSEVGGDYEYEWTIFLPPVSMEDLHPVAGVEFRLNQPKTSFELVFDLVRDAEVIMALAQTRSVVIVPFADGTPDEHKESSVHFELDGGEPVEAMTIWLRARTLWMQKRREDASPS